MKCKGHPVNFTQQSFADHPLLHITPFTVLLSVAVQLLQCSAANQSVSQPCSTVSAANTAELSNCFTTLPSYTHNTQYVTDNLQMSTKHLSNLGYEDYPYRKINVETHK